MCRHGRRQAQDRWLIGTDIRAQGDSGDQGLAVAGLDGVSRAERDRYRDEHKPRGG